MSDTTGDGARTSDAHGARGRSPAFPAPPSPAFRALSARLGGDPLQVQGPGGNTSIKSDGAMWIKASGTKLADAATGDVFVAVDVGRARAEVDGAGDGTCRAAMLDPGSSVRPSIETTFHALLDWPVVLHTHSVATLAHAVSERGAAVAMEKLAGMDAALVPYRKPGLPLTRAIREAGEAGTRVFVLRNHGLVVCGESIEDADARIREVERRLALAPRPADGPDRPFEAPIGWRALPWAAPLAGDLLARAGAGTLYPDHAVFLGPGLGTMPDRVDPAQRAAVLPGGGVMLREDAAATGDAVATREAMLRCLLDVVLRVDPAWGVEPIGAEAEAELMSWDAEEYRQKLAAARGAAP